MTLTQLGKQVAPATSPDEARIEKVRNPHTDMVYNIRFTCPEFTSLCPITGQPDFAQFVIDYVPDEHIVESKSLKLFLCAFRNHAAFHEDCTIGIAKRLIQEIKPKWLRIVGYWYPRGGIPIDIFYHCGEPPEHALIPEIDIKPYTGRSSA